MNTNKSIKFLKNIIKAGRIIFVDEKERMSIQEYIDKFEKAIEQFEICEKYELIVKEVKQYIIDRQIIEEGFSPSGEEIIDLIKWLEQKYFPQKIDKEFKKIFDKQMEKMIKEGNEQLLRNYCAMLKRRIETAYGNN